MSQEERGHSLLSLTPSPESPGPQPVLGKTGLLAALPSLPHTGAPALLSLGDPQPTFPPDVPRPPTPLRGTWTRGSRLRGSCFTGTAAAAPAAALPARAWLPRRSCSPTLSSFIAFQPGTALTHRAPLWCAGRPLAPLSRLSLGLTAFGPSLGLAEPGLVGWGSGWGLQSSPSGRPCRRSGGAAPV